MALMFIFMTFYAKLQKMITLRKHVSPLFAAIRRYASKSFSHGPKSANSDAAIHRYGFTTTRRYSPLFAAIGRYLPLWL